MRTKIEIAGKETEVRIVFRHHQYTTKEKMSSYEWDNWDGRVKGRTHCNILENDNHVVTYGTSYCSVTDCFSKEEGRKRSLTRAVSSLPKAERKKVWNAYLNRNENRKNKS